MVEINAYSKAKDGGKKLSTNFAVREFACKDGSDAVLVAPRLVMVLQSSLDDGGVNALLAGLAGGVERNGGTVELAGQLMDRRGTVGETTEGWKSRRLAYPMRKNKEGYFAVLRFSAPTAYITELERGLRLDENVLRYITVRGDA